MNVRKSVTKLITAVLLVVVTLSLLAAGTYAWFFLSTRPEAGGMRVSFGGRNTIQLAPDLVSPEGMHYPGEFAYSLAMNASAFGVLTPVSTADGVHWALPQYADLSGFGRRLDSYTIETDLSHANLAAGSAGAAEGAYAYIDLWVIAPQDCRLRVSTGTKANEPAGCFALPAPKAAEGAEGYELAPMSYETCSSLRVGFLVDERDANEAFLQYRESEGFDQRVVSLKGNYESAYETAPRFTAYEPNADLHADPALDGQYKTTSPIGADGQPTTVKDGLSAQAKTVWSPLLGELFAASLTGKTIASAAEAEAAFYGDYDQGLAYYMSKGLFYENAALTDGESLGEGGSGATMDVYIAELEANVPQRIRVFIWLEGQDVDCVNGAMAGDLLLRLELAGENAEH